MSRAANGTGILTYVNPSLTPDLSITRKLRSAFSVAHVLLPIICTELLYIFDLVVDAWGRKILDRHKSLTGNGSYTAAKQITLLHAEPPAKYHTASHFANGRAYSNTWSNFSRN